MRITYRELESFPYRRTKSPAYSPFSASWSDTLTLLYREVGMVGATSAVLELDLTQAELRLDGMPRMDARPRSSAVVISFEATHGPLQFATDRFIDWKDNVRAIALGLEALRKIDRYGIAQTSQQYAGYKALPSGGTEGVVGESDGKLSFDQAKAFMTHYGGDGDLTAQYRNAARKLHPDVNGGDRRLFQKLQHAMEVVKKYG